MAKDLEEVVVDEAKVQELIDSSIGNINTILDNINGEVI